MVNYIYKIEMKENTYDEYDAFVVCASSREEAIDLCGIKKSYAEAVDNLHEDNILEIKIIGIANDDIAKSRILGSYNAG
jgi:hypothetical protein